MEKAKITVWLTIITILIINFSIAKADISYKDGGTHNIDYNVSDIAIAIYDGGSPIKPTTVNLLPNGFFNYVQIFTNSNLNVSGGSIHMLAASENSKVNISSGSSRNTIMLGQSHLNISGGNLEVLSIENLYLNSPQRANISGGTVNKLFPCITLEQNQHINHTINFPSSSLSSYGLQIAPATVSLITTSFDILDSANLTVSSGNLGDINASDSSIVNISGGNIDEITSRGNSTVNFSGVSLSGEFNAWGNSTVNISGGDMPYLEASQNSRICISAGRINDQFRAEDNSTILIKGYDFSLSPGLSWGADGQTILGTGTLFGTWFNNTNFRIPISKNDTTATIMAIPEPATLLLLTLGTFAIIKKRKA